MVLSPVESLRRSRRIAFEGEEAAEREQDDAGAREESAVRDGPRTDEVDELRRDDAIHADDAHDPAQQRDQTAPVARPVVVRIGDRETADECQYPGKINERVAGQELPGHLAVDRV